MTRWPDRPVTQAEVAVVLGLSVSTISSWESRRNPTLPTVETVRRLAALYASDRSPTGAGLRIIDDDERAPEEQARFDELLTEVGLLREAARGGADEDDEEPPDLWRFPDGEPVRIICGALSTDDASRYAADEALNRIALFGYADVDALVELFGHLRKVNPYSSVEFRRSDRVRDEDLEAHLVLLGNMAWEQTFAEAFLPKDFPIRPVKDESVPDGEVFERRDDGVRFGPSLTDDGRVIEEVGLFLRTTSRLNRHRALTICSGVYTRGVYAAVRILTDDNRREHNDTQLRLLAGGSPTFGVLMKVKTFGARVVTPDLRDEDTILYSFALPS